MFIWSDIIVIILFQISWSIRIHPACIKFTLLFSLIFTKLSLEIFKGTILRERILLFSIDPSWAEKTGKSKQVKPVFLSNLALYLEKHFLANQICLHNKAKIAFFCQKKAKTFLHDRVTDHPCLYTIMRGSRENSTLVIFMCFSSDLFWWPHFREGI